MTWIRDRRVGLVYHDKAQTAGGYTLFSPVRGRHADLLDPDGRIVHQWRHPEGIQHVRWLPNGHLLVHTLPPQFSFGAQDIGGNAAALIELDHDSNVVWEYRDELMHHDYQRLDNGNTLVVRWERMPQEAADRVKGGYIAKNDPEWMWGDVIRELDVGGSIVREWKSWEHLSPDHHVKCPLESRKEWTHLNSLEITPDGHWLVSFRLSDRLCIIDAETGHVRWRWGEGVLSHQHHATWLENGNVLCFDNGCHRVDAPAFSQILEINPSTKETVWTYKSVPVLAFFSFMVSGTERLANGNTLITEGASGRIFEVTTEGETVWEYVSPWMVPSRFGPSTAVFRAYRIPEGDPRLTGLALSPTAYESWNDRIDNNEVLGVDDEPTV